MDTPVTFDFSSNILAKEFCEKVLLLSTVMIPVVGETSPDHMNFGRQAGISHFPEPGKSKFQDCSTP